MRGSDDLIKKAYLGQTVYIVAEFYRDVDGEVIAEKYYDIAKGRIKYIPNKRGYAQFLVEYKFDRGPTRIFWKNKKDIFEFKTDAIAKAIQLSDEEDRRLELYGFKKKVYRPWESSYKQMTLFDEKE